MSQGLGTAQRRLLVALYAAPVQEQLRWDIDYEDDELGNWASRRGSNFGRHADRPDGTEFYLITQLRLAEAHHPSLRNCSPRSIELYKLNLMDWFSLNENPTSQAERDLLRSWRAAYRRAARSLTERELIDTTMANVHLESLGQMTWGNGEIIRRTATFARITGAGRRYIEQRRADLVDATRDSDDLRRALRATGFVDIAQPPQRPEPVYRRRPRIRSTPRKQPTAAPGAAAHPGFHP